MSLGSALMFAMWPTADSQEHVLGKTIPMQNAEQLGRIQVVVAGWCPAASLATFC